MLGLAPVFQLSSELLLSLSSPFIFTHGKIAINEYIKCIGLHFAPYLVVHWVKIWTVGGHRSCAMNAGVSCSRSLIESRARCTGALYCCKMKKYKRSFWGFLGIGTGVSWKLNRHSTRRASPVSVDLQPKFRLMSGWGLWKRKSASPWARAAREGL